MWDLGVTDTGSPNSEITVCKSYYTKLVSWLLTTTQKLYMLLHIAVL